MDSFHYSELLLTHLPKGAFLTVAADGKVNTMTIGWGSIGHYWNKPIAMVMVRYSRYTYELIEKADSFTISLPLQSDLKKELSIAGSKSGRDIDKLAQLQLKAQAAKKIPSPVIEQCDLFYECRIVYKQPIDPEHLDPQIKQACYAQGDYHVLYHGEILASYLK
ncbi:MAG: flavin reductase family protein [Syntrophomonadaceae bacterium]|nr:flavin reductase family protein [Syntrophomonadaceae bacterium]